MFTSPKRVEGSPSDVGFSSGARSAATVIAHGVRVEGDFNSQGDVLIEGEVIGNVTVDGTLTIGTQARVKADVTAEQAVVAGTIEGNVTIKSHLDVKATAKIAGDMSCETVSVESGAGLSGRMVAGSKPSATNGMEKKATKAETKIAAE